MDVYNNNSRLNVSNLKDNMSYKKVYINPNFNKSNISDNSAKYIKPTFSNAVPSVDCKHAKSTKIYINPSFVRATRTQLPVNETPVVHPNSVINITSYESHVNNYNQNIKAANTVKNKSRYSLVRLNKTECTNVSVTKKPSNTVRISKHKLIPLNNMKNIIANTKCPGNINIKNVNGSPLIQRQNIVRPTVINMSKNNHKFIKYKPPLGSGIVANRCDVSAVNMVAIKKSNPSLKMRARKVLKKNNIPCPLFKKFGKCIRLVHGHCDFLHDRKHVSICRKFLNGVCHDKDCLLSHDLTVKKMPTCYFYLKGMCNKKDCPYLHIKLSEKSKVCSDFLKGYCEKGKKCLNRHVNISFYATSKTLNTSKQLCSNKYKTQFGNHKYKKNSVSIKYDVNKDKTDEIKRVDESKGHATEYRYYQDLNEMSITEKEKCEIIKPSRCKLGALPSFIQL